MIKLKLNYGFPKRQMKILFAVLIIFHLSSCDFIDQYRCYPDNSIMEKMTTHFIPRQNSFCIVTYPDIRFPGMLRYHRSKINWGSDDCFKGNVIVLVNERTGSFSEYLTMALQQNPKTITVGRATAGSDGNIVRMQFPGNVISWHSGVGIYYPDFTPTQRTGIKIDHIVEPDIESVSKGIDVALDKAKSLAKNLISTDSTFFYNKADTF
ncbi:MAG: hypothetical protein LBP83_08750 [Dysgonamonadaceae bacterium]|nr:hypothetical protein [Dysgonamonadaceae bacterium]